MSLSMIAFAFAVSLALGLATLPAGDGAQAVAAVLILLVMVLLGRYGRHEAAGAGPGRRRTVRLAMIFCGAALAIRYLVWRTTTTLPPVDDLSGFVPGVLLYGAELFSAVTLFVSLFVVADPLARPPAPRLPDASLPTVDVFVPTYNEDAALVATTLAAARALDYPADKLTVHVLDDGGTEAKCRSADPSVAASARRRRAEFAAMAADLGVVYVTRDTNDHAKAGNLNAGLARSRGELVAVFDADHAPIRSFLRETVGHFAEDPRLFLVQSPHVFLNPDPIEKNLGTFARMPSENEMFYGAIQRGLDKWNAAFFCGSAALLRRSALEEAGGFSGITITEDCETALELHARGWTSRYVDVPLVAGLQPESFDSFIGQRSRWCRGMLQVLILKNPLFRAGLTPAQRLSYLANALFWLFPLSRLAFMAAPLAYLFFGLELYVADIRSFAVHAGAYLAGSLVLQNFLYGRVRWPWISELYEYVQSFHLAGAIASVLRNPRRPTFAVTAKGETLAEDHLSPLAGPHLAMVVLLLAGVVMTGWRWHVDAVDADLTLFVGVWNLFNLTIALVGLGALVERRQRRRTHRMAVARTGEATIGEATLPVVVTDASIGGAGLRLAGPCPVPVRVGDMLALRVDPVPGGPRSRPLVAGVQRVGSEGGQTRIGVAFLGGVRDAEAIADLMFADTAALAGFVEGRRRHRGVVLGTLAFLGRVPAALIRSAGMVMAARPAAPRATPAVEAPRPLAAESDGTALYPVGVRRQG